MEKPSLPALSALAIDLYCFGISRVGNGGFAVAHAPGCQVSFGLS
jgi:hypothetical protein